MNACPHCGNVHARGRFQRGCPGPALRTGLHSALLRSGELPSQGDAAAALAEQQREIEQDLGGADVLSRVHRDAVRDLLRLGLVADFLFARLTQQGPLTAKGRSRAALSSYLAVVDRTTKLRTLVGIARRARLVDPLEAIRRAVQAANESSDGGKGASE